MDLRQLAKIAKVEGFAIATGTLDDIVHQGKQNHWTEVSVRRGDPPRTVLTPVTSENAKPLSLSKTYGLGAQPLHTDGAHLESPPDVLVLASEEPNKTPTLVRPLNRSLMKMGPLFYRYALHGIFLVQNGQDSFLTPVISESRLRYDPGCMIPCDQRARRISQLFAKELENAEVQYWDTPNKILVIDNRRTLHARAAVVSDDHSRAIQRIAFNIGGDLETLLRS